MGQESRPLVRRQQAMALSGLSRNILLSSFRESAAAVYRGAGESDEGLATGVLGGATNN